jgi:hypothetical protein
MWVLGVSADSIQYLGEYQGEPPTGGAPAAKFPSFGAFLEKKLKRTEKGWPDSRQVPSEGAA